MRLDALWKEILADSGLFDERPDFRFDPSFYAFHYPDIVANGMDLHKHYEAHGKSEGRKANAYQDTCAHLPELHQRLTEITIDPRLRDEIEAGTEGVFELIFELLSLGEPIDRALSNFSQRQYFQAYPDVQKAGVAAFQHFIRFGIAEGRRSLRDIRENQFRGDQSFDPDKPTCAICVHELSRSGAPIVGLDMARSAMKTHNVIIMALRSGALLEEFQKASFTIVISATPDQEVDYFDLPDLADLDFAFLNSVESFFFAPVFVRHSIPFASYLHEYADYTYPAYKFIFLALFSDLLVFSAAPVRDSWAQIFADMDFDVARDSPIVSQAELRLNKVGASEFREARANVSKLLGVDCSNRRLIYGAGHAQWRKGTDLFALTAQIARKKDPEALFVWVGDGLNHEEVHFGVWMDKHLRAAGANTADGNLFFLPAGDHYLDISRAADALFLPSRLDPLPNVVFDALSYDCQVVLFETATGYDDDTYADCDKIKSVEYGDLLGACDALLSTPMKRPAGLLNAKSRRTKSKADVFAKISTALRERVASQRHFVAGEGEYDVPIAFSEREEDQSSRKLEREKMWSYGRRFVWQSSNQAEGELAASDNWMHQNSRIERFAWCDTTPSVDYSIHIHAHYIDKLGGDLLHYRALREARRIVVTTDTANKADRIGKIGKSAGVEVEPLVVPNQGRDILPFMRLFSNGIAQRDEIWCHIHQKKSIGVSSAGEVWRQFLLAVLLGDDKRLSSAIDHIAAPDTGLVTAFDPYMVDWAGSRRLLPQIAPKLPGPIPDHVLMFPVGNMFWTRGSVVEEMNNLFGADYPWPNEPIANDGTVFHLIERLWPAVSVMKKLNSVFLDKPDQKRV